MELILVVVISAGMAGNSPNGVSRSLTYLYWRELCHSSGKLQMSYQSLKRETDVNQKIL